MFCIWIRDHFYCHWNVLSDNCHSPCHAMHIIFFFLYQLLAFHAIDMLAEGVSNTKHTHTHTHLSMVFMTHRNALLGNRRRNRLHMARETTNGFHFQTKNHSICHKPLNCVRFDIGEYVSFPKKLWKSSKDDESQSAFDGCTQLIIITMIIIIWFLLVYQFTKRKKLNKNRHSPNRVCIGHCNEHPNCVNDETKTSHKFSCQ